MNYKKFTILIFLISLNSCSQEGILFKNTFKPNKKYSTNSVVSNVVTIDVEADKETIDQLNTKGYKMPMVTEEERNVQANFTTEEKQENGEFLATVQYGKIIFKNSINGNSTEEEKPYSEIKVLGKYNKENDFVVDSIAGYNISFQNKNQFESLIKSQRESVRFPDYPLKLNDSFEYEISETTNVPGFKTIHTNLLIKLTLIEINEGKAYFNIEQAIDLDSKDETVKLVSTEKGTGKLVFDIDEEIISEFISEYPLELFFLVNEKLSFRMKLESKTKFHRTII